MSSIDATPGLEPSATRQLCTFLVNGTLFGIDVMDVQEVIRQQNMTPVPLAPKLVSGLINLRGQIVTALNLRERLGMADEVKAPDPMNIVIRRAEGVVSLMVDEVGDIVDVDENTFEPPPATLPASARHLVRGAYKLNGQLLVFLDTALATQTGRQSNSSVSDAAGVAA
jgi:purine-binding chemotaxis protein CheW